MDDKKNLSRKLKQGKHNSIELLVSAVIKYKQVYSETVLV